MIIHLLFHFLLTIICIQGFSAPGAIPPESFNAERWYPNNLPTVMPPWKMPGANVESFRTARPPQAGLPTTTVASPTNSLPMPPGSIPPVENITTTGPHPPAPSPHSIMISSNSSANSTENIEDESMIVSVTATNLVKEPVLPDENDNGILTILSSHFEDITKIENLKETQDIVSSIGEGSGSGDEPINEGFLKSNELTLDAPIENTTTLVTTQSIITTISEASTTTTMTITSTEAPKTTPEVSTTKAESKPTTEASTTTIFEKVSTEQTISPESTSTTLKSTEIKTEASTISSETTRTTPFAVSTVTQSTTIAPTTPSPKQSIARAPEKDCGDILFLLDSSGNVVQQYEKQKRYIEEIVQKINMEHPRNWSLITYSGRQRQKIVVPLPTKPNSVQFLDRLKKARYLRGVTATGAAISVTTQYVLQKGRKVQVVVVTDGFSFDDVEKQAEALRTVGAETLVSGRYTPVVKNVLLAIAGNEKNVFFDKKEAKLLEALKC